MVPKESKTRIVCFAPSDVAEMIDLMVLLYGLRRNFQSAHIAVVCEASIASLAQSCSAVNEVIILKHSPIPGWAAFKNAARIRNFDWAIAATLNVDYRLAALVKRTKAKIRIGFERRLDKRSAYYTDPVALPKEPDEEHRVETFYRLLKPLGIHHATSWSADHVHLNLPQSAREFATETMLQRPFILGTGYVLINLRSSLDLKFSENDILMLARNLLSATSFAIALVADPVGQQVAAEIGLVLNSDRIGVIETMLPLEFAALLGEAVLLITVEDEAAHLAAAMNTPAVVVWSKGPFRRTHSRGRRHAFIQMEDAGKGALVDRIWQAAQTLLTSKNYDVEKQWTDLLESAPPPDLDS